VAALMNIFGRWSSLLFSSVLYLGRTPVLLDRNGERIRENNAREGSRAVILGKRAYFETIAEFPFSDMKEIKAAVMLSPTDYAPFATDLFFIRKIGRSNDRTRVNLWFVRPGIIEEIRGSAAWFVFPETALWSIDDRAGPRLYCFHRETDRLMVNVDAHGAVRSSLAENSGEDDIEAFRRSLGPRVADCATESLDSLQDYFHELSARLSKASIADLVPFFKWMPGSSKPDSRLLRRTAASLSALIFLYLIACAGLPLFMKQKLTAENEALSASLGEVLNRQADIEAIQRRIQTLAGPLETYLSKTALFNLLYDTLTGRCTITRMTVAGRRVEIEGTSPQASDILSALSAVESFETVRLTRPLKKDRGTGHDAFSIGFYVKPGAFIESENKDGA
jgi:hypothetical protein